MKKFHFISLLFVAMILAFNSCRKINGVGPVVQEERALSGFNRVSVATGATVHITQGAAFEVVLEAQQNILDVIKTEVNGGELVIDNKQHTHITSWKDVHVYITIPEVEGLTLTGSGDIQVQNEINTQDLELRISGSGNIYLPQLLAGSLQTTISGSGYVQIDDGKVQQEILNITGSGSMKLSGLESKEADVTISGSGDARIFVTDRLNVRISGSGNVYYKGSPTVDVHITGSGRLQPQ